MRSVIEWHMHSTRGRGGGMVGVAGSGPAPGAAILAVCSPCAEPTDKPWTTHRAITTIITFTVRVKRQSQAVLGALHEAFVAAEAPGWRGRRGLRKGESDCSYGRQHCCGVRAAA